jgi:cytochrome P450
MRRIVDETLRLWPVAPGYFRQAKTDTVIGDRYAISGGDWVFVLLLAAHRDPAWGPDADEFNPDRFLPENIRTLPPHIYKPFGTGARSCPGRQFALHEIVPSGVSSQRGKTSVWMPDWSRARPTVWSTIASMVCGRE